MVYENVHEKVACNKSWGKVFKSRYTPTLVSMRTIDFNVKSYSNYLMLLMIAIKPRPFEVIAVIEQHITVILHSVLILAQIKFLAICSLETRQRVSAL
jgi:hypothetical protein